MARSLSLNAYLTFARREALTWIPSEQLRPEGTVIWVHCAEPARANAMAQLAQRIATQRPIAQIILTVPPSQKLPESLPSGVIALFAPSENPADVDLFLQHWSPDILLWLGPWLRPSLIHGATRHQIPLFLLDADEITLERRNWRWLPDSQNATLQLFTQIFARDSASGFRLRRALGMDSSITDSGPLLEDSPALQCSESDLDDLSESLTARPVWLAAHLRPEELDHVLAAQRAAMRQSPRMLLIIVPAQPDQTAEIHKRLRSENWRVSLWDDGEFPEEKSHVLLAENREELGLFFRVAPITFMGSSLLPGSGGRNPFEPAALGSAILYGPSVRKHLNAYSRLARAGAARIVKDQASLSAALDSLLAPDKVAKMVHAGWETVSEGATVIDHIVEQVSEALDQKGSL